jgi:hypothetical protein
MTRLTTILPSVSSRFRALLGACGLEPPPDIDALARKHARKLVEMGHLDLDHPSAEDMLFWRFKAALEEAIASNREDMP